MSRGGGSRAWGGSLVLVLVGCAPVLPLGDPDRWEDGACRARLVLDPEESPREELRELGRDVGAQDRFPAAVIDPERQRPVEATAAMQLDGVPIAWFSTSLDVVVLDGGAFAPLRTVDVTRSDAGEPRAVGRVMPSAQQALGGRGVVELLLRVGAIQAYRQLGADLCLVAEEAAPRYRARWTGVHHLAARGEQEEPLDFVVEIEVEGQIVVVVDPTGPAG